jgi:hypothetical protein
LWLQPTFTPPLNTSQIRPLLIVETMATPNYVERRF